MKHRHTACLVAFLLATGLHAGDFKLTLNATNAQVANLILGCQQQAKDGMDQLDIPVPPFGMGSGTISLKHANPDVPSLYQDMRSNQLPQTWTIACEPKHHRKIVISWKKEQLPKDITLIVTLPNRKSVNMNTRSTVTLTKKGKVIIKAQPTTPQK